MKKREIKVIPYISTIKKFGYINFLPEVSIQYSSWQDDKYTLKGQYGLTFGFLIFRVTIELSTWQER